MRLATFNVENLFDRAKAMNLDSWTQGRIVLEKFAAANRLLGQVEYRETDKAKLAELFVELGLEKNDLGPFVILRRNRGGLVKRPRTGGIEIIANGRIDWVGSLELRTEPIDEIAMQNTARTIAGIEADVLAVVEAESRPVLAEFNEDILPAVRGAAFRHVMVIDGNDDRGIDVGLMTRSGFPIDWMRSHVDDRTSTDAKVFSRDCPEFFVGVPSGAQLLVLVNHFKSKGYGSQATSDERRKLQATRVKEIYEAAVDEGYEFIAVVGDLNDVPDSKPLKPLLSGTDLKDAFDIPGFDDGGYPGTHGSCGKSSKIDYLLLSPKLVTKFRAGGVYRKGMFPGKRPKWDAFPEVDDPKHAGSDHAAVWVDLDL